MTVEEKKALNKARVNAVKQAWVNECDLVAQGKCTRQWSEAELAELSVRGRVAGYPGHHMYNVNDYPQYAGDPNNIQFLTTKEHIAGAHNNHTRSATNGYYNHVTKTTELFHGPPRRPVYSLRANNKVSRSAAQTQARTVSQTGGQRSGAVSSRSLNASACSRSRGTGISGARAAPSSGNSASRTVSSGRSNGVSHSDFF